MFGGCMKFVFNIIFFLSACCSAYSNEMATPFTTDEVKVDTKNVLASAGNLLILRSYDGSWVDMDFNYRSSYLEAYDINTGDLVWIHRDNGMIVSFLIVDSKLILRNRYKITALDLNSGKVLWTKETRGEYSTIQGE